MPSQLTDYHAKYFAYDLTKRCASDSVNFSESLQTYLEYTGQVDAEGRKFGTNTDADGRFHSKWLNMMYPRLYLARNLLGENGIIFVNIDDSEQENLRKVCNEVFGEENFVAQVVWEKGRKNDAKLVSVGHEYCYSRRTELTSMRPAQCGERPSLERQRFRLST